MRLSQYKIRAFLAIWVVFSCAAQYLMATDYTVDSTQSASATNFHSLEDLRQAGITWVNGDTITLFGDDHSLTDAIDVNGKFVTFKGYGTVTPNGQTALLINPWGGGNVITILPDNGKTLDFSGFDYSGWGGVIDGGSGGSLTFGAAGSTGTVNFHDNQSVGHGGAIFAGRNITFTDGNYLFSGNSAKLSGGAIYAGQAIIFTDGNYIFSGNSAKVDGGAIYANMGLMFTDGNYVFSGNSAKLSGGVIFAYNNFTFTDGNYLFSGNSAGWHGGAINANMGLMFTDGNYVFSGNTAGWRGGAIYVGDNLAFTDGNYVFSGNTVMDDGSYSDIGLGGAIYASGSNVSIVNAAFLGNKTITSDLTDPTTGRGGAIFYNATGGTKTFTLDAKAEEIVFQGNMHRDGMTPNGIYFGSIRQAPGDTATIAATFKGDHDILMHDPMESQEFTDYAKLTLNISKEGTGRWLLGSESNLNSKASVTIDEGTFELARGASLNLNHADQGKFAVKSGAVFRPTVFGDTVSTVNTQTVDLQAGSRLEVAGISSLAAGDKTFADAITAANPTINNMTPFTPNSGSIFTEAKFIAGSGNNLDLAVTGVRNMSDVFGTSTFIDVYRKLELSDDERAMFDEIYFTGTLTDKFKDRSLQERFTVMEGNTILDATDAKRTDAEFFRHLLFDRLESDDPITPGNGMTIRGQSCRTTSRCTAANLWGTFTQNWTEQGLTSYKPYAFTFGRDRRVGRWAFGLAGQYIHGNVRSNAANIDTHVEADALAFGLYAGRTGRHWYGKGTMQFGIGWNDVDTNYRSTGDRTSGSYDSATLGTGFELGRNYRFGCATHPLTITPHAGVDYFFLHGEGFDEHGSNFQRSFGSVNYNVVELPIGVRIAKTYAMTGGKANWLRPNVDLTYVRSVGDAAPVTTASFLADPSSSWRAAGTDIGRDVFRMNLGLDGRFLNRFDTDLSYRLETRNDYTAHQLTAGVACKW